MERSVSEDLLSAPEWALLKDESDVLRFHFFQAAEWFVHAKSFDASSCRQLRTAGLDAQSVNGCVLPGDCQLAGNSDRLVRMRLSLIAD